MDQSEIFEEILSGQYIIYGRDCTKLIQAITNRLKNLKFNVLICLCEQLL